MKLSAEDLTYSETKQLPMRHISYLESKLASRLRCLRCFTSYRYKVLDNYKGGRDSIHLLGVSGKNV